MMTEDRNVRIEIPSKAARILDRLMNAGHEAYVVGGCVRDSLLGIEPHDWDITTSARPEAVKALFKKTVDTGLKHGTVTVLLQGEGFEVTTYRVDGAYKDGRHPEKVTFTSSLAEDLRRRDFTINAMAYNDRDGLVDLFGGQKDLEEGLIRAVGCPRERFSEDALRIMRAVRFAARFGFRIEEKTREAAASMAGNLKLVSAERIRAELDALLVSPHPEMLRDLYEMGITAVFLPEFDLCMETPQVNPHHMYTVGEHTIQSIRGVAPDLTLRLTMLLHDFGKPAARTTDSRGIDHFWGHPEISEKISRDILRRLRYDNRTRDRVLKLVLCHDDILRLTEAGIRRYMVKIGPDLFPLLLQVKAADIRAQSMYMRAQKESILLRAGILYERVARRGDCVRMADLAVKGEDLIRAGMEPGPRMGEVLKAMFEEVLENPRHNTRSWLLERFGEEISEKPPGKQGQ